MKRYLLMLSGLVLVLALCFYLPLFTSASEVVTESDGGVLVNGGLEAEILTGDETDGAVPVTVKITNTNSYDMSGIGYILTAGENGKLSGKTQDGNLTVAGGSSITASATLKAASGINSPGGKTLLIILLITLGVLIAAGAVFAVIKFKKHRQSMSMLLAFIMLAGVFATVGIPISASAADSTQAPISFTVTKDVSIGGKAVRLSLEVTLPDSAGDGNHTVSFMDSENQTIKTLTVPNGGIVPVDEIPTLTKNGKLFGGWALDTDGTGYFYSDDPIEKDMTLYPVYSDLLTDKYYSPAYYDAGFVEQTHRVVIISESAITTATLSDFATLETLFGTAPEINVTSLGDNKYELSGVYSSAGTYCWSLTDENVTFDTHGAEVREYGFTVGGEETESYSMSKDLRDIAEHELISLEETADQYISILNVYGKSYAVGDKIGVPDLSGEITYYKVTSILGSQPNPTSGNTSWRLQVTPCTMDEIYDVIDINQHNREADNIIDISNPQDIENYLRQIENSEQMRIYADYLASAINDSASFRLATTEAYGMPAYIDYQSDTLIAASLGSSSADNAADAIDEALKLVGGISINRPGVNLSISASAPTIKLDDFNSYWDKRYAEFGEVNPETLKREHVGDEDYFGHKFASVSTAVTITFSLNGGTKNIAVECTLTLKQYVKICSATQVKLEYGWQMYKGSEINAGATVYSETSVDFTVVLKTDNGGFDVTDEINNIISAAKGEEYESDNRYIKRFRNLYDGSEDDFVEVFRWDFCQFRFSVGPVEVNVPVAFVVRFALSAGVGIGYDYRTTYSVGVTKEKNSGNITPYAKTGTPGWEFNLYVAGHVGIKAGLVARMGITITNCSKIFEIGLEAELGLRADFYGYYMLRQEKVWTSDTPTSETMGAYYFNAKIYFTLKLFASAFTFEMKWDLYSWEEEIFTSGNRYVLLDFNKRLKEQTEPIIIPVTKDSKLTRVQDGKVSYDTILFYLDSYFNSLEPVLFDLTTANEVLNKTEAAALINQYTTVTTGGILTLPNGRTCATGNTSLHLRPEALNTFLTEKKQELNTYIKFTYNGPVFTLGEEKPSVIINVKLVSEKYLTGERYDVKFMVNGNLYMTERYLEGTVIPPWKGRVPKDYCESIGITSAYFDIPVDGITKNMELHANCTYPADNTVTFKMSTMTNSGIAEYDLNFFMPEVCKGYEVADKEHMPGIMAEYFIGWDLEGDNSDELNLPITKQNTDYVYRAVYRELPEYTVKVIDGLTDAVLSETKVRLGDSYTIAAPALPDDGHAYESFLSFKSGSYACKDYVPGASSVIYPFSDLTLVWNHALKKHTVRFYSDYNGTPLATVLVEDGAYIVDPVGRENWSQLNYQDDSYSYYEFTGWEVWNGSAFVNAEAFPITNHCSIMPVFIYRGIKHNIKLLAEDGKTLLFDGVINNNMPLDSVITVTQKRTDKEYTYKLVWKSSKDGSLTEKAFESGTYTMFWEKKAREYRIVLDPESAKLAGDAVAFNDIVTYDKLQDYITKAIGSFVPQKPATSYETFVYDGFIISCDANQNGEYGICTVLFNFTSDAQKCAVTFNVNGSDGKTGTLWFGQKHLTLTNGTYVLNHSINAASPNLIIGYDVAPADRNYNFVGWSYGGKIYSIGDSLPLSGLNAVTLTAVYERKPHTVTLNTDGGTATGDLTVYADTNEYITLPTPTKASDTQYDYRFSHWSNGSSHFTGTYKVSSTVTLTAVYDKTIRKYNITFNANGGKFDGGKESISVLTDYGTMPTAAIPVKADTASERYTFNGWSPAVVNVTGVAEYTAKWKVTKLYTLTFNAGDGKFSPDGAKTKTYTVEEGKTFNIGTVPEPYYNHNGSVCRFDGWSPSGDVITVNANQSFTATWSNPVSAVGIFISDGKNTEDIAAYLAGAQSVQGYSFKYITDVEGYDPFFLLEITANGLTLSGNGTVDYIDVNGVDVTLDGLTLESAVTAYGDCTFTIDGVVTVTAVDNTAIALSETPLGSDEPTSHGNLNFVGADSSAKLIVITSGVSGGIRSFDGGITITGLNVDITANEYTDAYSDDINIPVALGTMDASFNVIINNSTVMINKGYLSGVLQLNNSTVEFKDNAYNGLTSHYYDYTAAPVMPESVVSLNNSDMIFHGGAYMVVSYSAYYSDPPADFWFYKLDGEDAEGLPIIGRYAAQQEFDSAMATLDDAWMIKIGEGSSIQIKN